MEKMLEEAIFMALEHGKVDLAKEMLHHLFRERQNSTPAMAPSPSPSRPPIEASPVSEPVQSTGSGSNALTISASSAPPTPALSREPEESRAGSPSNRTSPIVVPPTIATSSTPTVARSSRIEPPPPEPLRILQWQGPSPAQPRSRPTEEEAPVRDTPPQEPNPQRAVAVCIPTPPGSFHRSWLLVSDFGYLVLDRAHSKGTVKTWGLQWDGEFREAVKKKFKGYAIAEPDWLPTWESLPAEDGLTSPFKARCVASQLYGFEPSYVAGSGVPGFACDDCLSRRQLCIRKLYLEKGPIPVLYPAPPRLRAKDRMLKGPRRIGYYIRGVDKKVPRTVQASSQRQDAQSSS